MKYLIVAALAITLAGCGAAPCATERVVVSAVDVAIEAAADIIPGHEAELDIARGVADLGDAAVDACEVLRDGEGWQQWLSVALDATGAIMDIIVDALGEDDVPPELLAVRQMIEAMQ